MPTAAAPTTRSHCLQPIASRSRSNLRSSPRVSWRPRWEWVTDWPCFASAGCPRRERPSSPPQCSKSLATYASWPPPLYSMATRVRVAATAAARSGSTHTTVAAKTNLFHRRRASRTAVTCTRSQAELRISVGHTAGEASDHRQRDRAEVTRLSVGQPSCLLIGSRPGTTALRQS
jgi:hypothetical protein